MKKNIFLLIFVQIIAFGQGSGKRSASILATNNAAPFSFNSSTQTINVPQSPTLVNNVANGTLTFNKGDGTAATTINLIGREIFEVVKATADGQTVFQSTIMPSGYNKNRLVIEIQNGDLKLTKEDGYTYNTATQTLTLTLTGFTLEANNEIRFCFY